jgi:acyl-CoA thioester hydrolase
MAKIFSRTFRVRFDEVDIFGRVGSPQILSYFVETAWDWGASEGLSLEDSAHQELLWLVREMEFGLYRQLRYNETFTTTIWLIEWRRVRGMRGFEIRSEDTGELCVQGVNQVAVLDPETMRPLRAPEEMIDRFRLETPRMIPFNRFPRFPNPPNGHFSTTRRVEWRDLDMYGHVNNGVYPAYMDEAMMGLFKAAGWPPDRLKEAGLALEDRQLHIQFQEPALWGENLDLSSFMTGLDESGGKLWTAIRRGPDDAPIAAQVATGQLTDLESAEPRPIPDELRRNLALM